MSPLLAHASFWELPLVLGIISLVYSATRYDSWNAILRDATHRALTYLVILLGVALLLAGVALNDQPFVLRSLLFGAGAVLEIAVMLFAR